MKMLPDDTYVREKPDGLRFFLIFWYFMYVVFKNLHNGDGHHLTLQLFHRQKILNIKHEIKC